MNRIFSKIIAFFLSFFTVIRKQKLVSFYLVLSMLFMVCLCDFTILKNSETKVYSSANEIPHNKVGVILGASKNLSNGSRNPYFQNRLLAAIKLYNAQKIDYILVSGENSSVTYNEPEDFKNELLKAGIPENKIYLDYAGFRTLDSMIRAKKVFGLTEFTIISQNFHNERALYIAKQNGINAVAFNAKDVQKKYQFFQNMREYLARIKVFLDIAVNKKPKFLGTKIYID